MRFAIILAVSIVAVHHTSNLAGIDLPRSSPFGDVIRARSESRITDEIAKQKAITTRKLKVENYWYLKRLNQRERAKDTAMRRAKRERYLSTKGSGQPQRLSSRELDRLDGRINWPTTLQARVYAPERTKLEALFTESAKTGNRTGMAQEILTTCNALERKLKKNMNRMPSSEYISAKKFVRSLKDEHRHL